MFIRTFSFLLIFLVCSHKSYAELPLDLEELFTDKGKFKLDFLLTYANSNRSELSTGFPVLVQIGPTQFISLPSEIEEGYMNRDTFIPSLGLRYGLGAKTEVYGKNPSNRRR
jgi:hypothetical protein